MKSGSIVSFLLGVALTAAVLAVVLGTDILPTLFGSAPTPTPTASPTLPATPSPSPSPSPSASPSPSPSPSPSDSAAPTPGVHVVQSGDTLIGIGTLYGVPWQLIATENGLEEPYALSIGDELIIPGPPPGALFYVVEAGDTLFDIAYMFQVNPDDIITANAIIDPNAIQIGQVLIIPNAAPTPSPAP